MPILSDLGGYNGVALPFEREPGAKELTGTDI